MHILHNNFINENEKSWNRKIASRQQKNQTLLSGDIIASISMCVCVRVWVAENRGILFAKRKTYFLMNLIITRRAQCDACLAVQNAK